jgi:serine O-acetyltransferase
MDRYPESSVAALVALRRARACFHSWLYRVSAEREIVAKDVERWNAVLGGSAAGAGSAPGGGGPGAAPKRGLADLVAHYPEFRALFHYRVARERRLGIRALLALADRCWRPLESLYIVTPSIGPGLFIQHGFSTIIAAKSLGENCWVNQQVTIGFSSVDDCPTLGNNVSVKAGAIVIGDITIGDGAVVGAGAVVVKDVPPFSTVVGVPARIVGRGASNADAPRDAR